MPRAATETRHRIVQAAATLFSLHGYDGTTVNDVLEATGITKGALYYYFSSKEALCRAVIDHAVREVRDLAVACDDPTDALKTVRQCLAALLEKGPSERSVYGRLLVRLSLEAIHLEPRLQRSLRSFWQWHETWLAQRLEHARQADCWPADLDRQACARALARLWAGSILTAQVAPDPREAMAPTEWLLATLSLPQPGAHD